MRPEYDDRAAVTVRSHGRYVVAHEIRHRRIRATIWRNDTAKGPMYNVTISRSFREGEQWKDSRSFAFDDLMNVAKALYDAHSFISAQHAKDRTGAATARQPTRLSRTSVGK